MERGDVRVLKTFMGRRYGLNQMSFKAISLSIVRLLEFFWTNFCYQEKNDILAYSRVPSSSSFSYSGKKLSSSRSPISSTPRIFDSFFSPFFVSFSPLQARFVFTLATTTHNVKTTFKGKIIVTQHIRSTVDGKNTHRSTEKFTPIIVLIFLQLYWNSFCLQWIIIH